jgi:hypothetical protein
MAVRRGKSSSAEHKIDEYSAPDEGAFSQPIEEFDPNAPNVAAAAAATVEAVGQGVAATADLLAARDELEARIGGVGAMVAAASHAVTQPEFGLENITGIGVGMKLAAGGFTGELSVKVYVREKAPLHRVAAAAVVPPDIDGVPTDVEQVGELFPQSYARWYPRPVPCGVSCGHVRITAGTLGCLAVLNNNRLVILSNNHVLANENDAQPGDPIIQPGRVDGGQNPAHLIGALERFVPINFPGPNLVDAAAAWTSFSLVSRRHVTYAMSPTPAAVRPQMVVMKNGRTTQATAGVVTGVHVNGVRVTYTAGVAVFNDQVVIQGIGGRPFSAGGDSGSVIVVAATRQPVALLFAGSATHTIANPIAAVMSQLGISRFLGG